MQFVGRSRSECGVLNAATGLHLACMQGLYSSLAAKGACSSKMRRNIVVVDESSSRFFSPGGC